MKATRIKYAQKYGRRMWVVAQDNLGNFRFTPVQGEATVFEGYDFATTFCAAMLSLGTKAVLERVAPPRKPYSKPAVEEHEYQHIVTLECRTNPYM
jgi:hypothetical protein